MSSSQELSMATSHAKKLSSLISAQLETRPLPNNDTLAKINGVGGYLDLAVVYLVNEELFMATQLVEKILRADVSLCFVQENTYNEEYVENEKRKALRLFDEIVNLLGIK